MPKTNVYHYRDVAAWWARVLTPTGRSNISDNGCDTCLQFSESGEKPTLYSLPLVVP